MTRHTKTLKLAVLPGAVALAALAYFLSRGPARPAGAYLGGPAPDFALSDLAGRRVTLSSYRGKPVLLNFWATWCTSCEEELPDLKKLQTEKRQELSILGISVDDAGKKAVMPFVARFDLNFPVLLSDVNTARAYGVRALPTSWLIGPDGVVAKKYVGPLEFAEVENDILALTRRPS